MRSPIRSIPPGIEHWAARARWLRWLDAAMAGAGVWLVLAGALDLAPLPSAAAAALVAGGLSRWHPLRLRWRPASALVSLAASRGLRPGDRAWYVRPDRAEPVIVTARRGLRLVVARPDDGPAEGIEVRRTRILVVPLSR